MGLAAIASFVPEGAPAHAGHGLPDAEPDRIQQNATLGLAVTKYALARRYADSLGHVRAH